MPEHRGHKSPFPPDLEKDTKSNVAQQESSANEIKIEPRFDVIDIRLLTRTAFRNLLIGSGAITSAAVAENYLGYTDLANTTARIFTLYALTFSVAGGFLALHENYKRKHTSISNKALGYSAIEIVFDGDDPVEKDTAKVNKSDSVLFAQLPPSALVRQGKNDEKSLQRHMRQAVSASVSEIQERTRDWEYSAVALYVSPQERSVLGSRIKDSQKITSEELLEGKRSSIKQISRDLYLLSREDFEALAEQDKDELEKAAHALGDKTLLDRIDLLRQAKTDGEQQRAKQIVIDRVKGVLLSELESEYNGPQLHKGFDTQTLSHFKTKEHATLRLTERNDGLHLMSISDQGRIQNVSLHNILSGNIGKLGEVIDSVSPMRNAEIAYTIFHILRSQDVYELREEQELSPEIVSASLRNAGIAFAPAEKVEDLIVDLGKTGRRELLKIQRSIAPILISLLIATGIQATAIGLEKLDRAFDEAPKSDFFNRPGDADDLKMHRPGFAENVPRHGLAWKITSINGMSDDGYFTLFTSNVMDDDLVWKEHTKRKGEFTNKKILGEESQPFLLLQDRVDTSKKQTVKIPMRNNATLYDVVISDLGNDHVNHTVYELTDGTYEISFPDSEKGKIVDIFVRETESTAIPQIVRAVEQIEPINKDKIGEWLQGWFVNWEALSRSSGNRSMFSPDNMAEEQFQQLVTDMTSNKNYSINPSTVFGEILDVVQTREEFVELAQKETACSCEVCNTQAALLNTLMQNDETFTNYAIGYLHGADNMTSIDGDYLYDETAHGYQVDNEGVIVDATATSRPFYKEFEDPETIEYFALLEQIATGDFDTEWDDQVAEMDTSEDQEFYTYLKFAAMLVVASGAVTLAKPVVRRFQNLVKAQESRVAEAKETTEHLMAERFSRGDLELTFDFLNWVSYAGNAQKFHQHGEEEYSYVRDKYKTNSELLQAMRSSVQIDVIQSKLGFGRSITERLRNSQDKTNLHGLLDNQELTEEEKAKIKFITNYLIETKE